MSQQKLCRTQTAQSQSFPMIWQPRGGREAEEGEGSAAVPGGPVQAGGRQDSQLQHHPRHCWCRAAFWVKDFLHIGTCNSIQQLF